MPPSFLSLTLPLAVVATAVVFLYVVRERESGGREQEWDEWNVNLYVQMATFTAALALGAVLITRIWK